MSEAGIAIAISVLSMVINGVSIWLMRRQSQWERGER